MVSSIRFPGYGSSDRGRKDPRQSTCQQIELQVSGEQGGGTDMDSSQTVFPSTVYENLSPAQGESVSAKVVSTYQGTQSSISHKHSSTTNAILRKRLPRSLEGHSHGFRGQTSLSGEGL